MRLRSVLLAGCLLAASCGDSGDTGAPTDPSATDAPDATVDDAGAPPADAADTGGDPVELTASFRGVTPEVIKVGVTAIDWDTLAQLGVDFGSTNSLDLWEAALEDINARGGVNGRMLEIYGREFLPLGSDQFDQACAELTQDEEVFVVVGQALEDQILCLIELGSTAAIAVAGMADPILERSNAPYATLWARFETQAENLVALVESQGVLEGATVGVVGSVDVGVIEYQTIVDAFRDAGFDVVEGLIGGNDSDLAETARDQAIVYERMAEAGVDFTVSTTGAPLEIFNAQNENYATDQWLLTVVMTPSALVAQGVDLDYLDGALAIVNTPVGTTAQESMADDPAVAACVDMLEAGSDHDLFYEIDVEKNDLTAGLYACAISKILEAALTAAGPDLTNESFAAGLESIGEIELPGYFGASLEAGELGAAKELRLARFDSAAGAWELIE